MLIESVEQVQEALRANACVAVQGGGTKPALIAPEAALRLDMTALAGVLEYEPAEFTFSARAGTRVAAVEALLAEHGQYLPFDPPLVERGATLGGTVAAGLSGPGRYRSGGVRDFILAVQFVDGAGEVIRGGGKVVKNAAGFDLPKLMVGSLGRLGVLVEVAFKVFPRPEASLSLRLECPTLEGAHAALLRLYGAALDVDALDLEPSPAGAVVWVRLAGLAEALPGRAERVRVVLGGGEVVTGSGEVDVWRAARELTWVPDGWSLIKAALVPRQVVPLEAALTALPDPQAVRRYSAGGNLAWIATAGPIAAVDEALRNLRVPGLVLMGSMPGGPLIGHQPGAAFGRRVKQALDPQGHLGEIGSKRLEAGGW